MRKRYEAVMLLVGLLGWWGFVYPDLCLTEETCEEESYEEETEEEADESSFWERGLKVGDLCIKSRAAEYVYQIREKKEQKRD